MSSPTMYIKGVKLGTDKHKAMVNIAKDCISIGIKPPKEVIDYLGKDWEDSDEIGVVVTFQPQYGSNKVPNGFITSYRKDMTDGYEIDLERLALEQPDVKILRVYVSY